jgi:hypothetical protein
MQFYCIAITIDMLMIHKEASIMSSQNPNPLLLISLVLKAVFQKLITLVKS